MSKLKKIVIYLFFLCLGMHSAFSETPEQITFSYILKILIPHMSYNLSM